MENFDIKTKTRTVEGKKVKQLRREGFLPAVIFSKKSSKAGEKPVNIQVDAKEFYKVYAAAKETHLINLNIDGAKAVKVLVSEVQRDSVSLVPSHVSFYKVDLTEKVTASIPVVLLGVEDHELLKTGEGVLLHVLKEITIECLPTDLPDHFDVSIADIKELGEALTVAEAIKVDPAVITVFDEPDEVIAKIDFPQKEEVVEETPKSVDDVEVIEKGKSDADDADNKTDSSDKKSED